MGPCQPGPFISIIVLAPDVPLQSRRESVDSQVSRPGQGEGYDCSKNIRGIVCSREIYRSKI